MRVAKIALSAAGLLLGLGLCELLLGWLYPQIYHRPKVWQYDRNLGWAHIPAAVDRLITPEFDVKISINADGLRDREFPEQNKGPRLLAFGDSFIEGWGVDIDDSVSKLLESRLRKAWGEGVEVRNFGVAGYGTDQELLFFQQSGAALKPDRVLVFFYANDLWNNVADRGIGAERGGKPFFRPGAGGRLTLRGVPVKKSPFWEGEDLGKLPWTRRWDRILGQRSHTYVLVRQAFAPEVPQGQQQAYYLGLYGSDTDPRWERAWALSGMLLHRFARSVKSAGAQMLVVYIPAIVQIEAENWQLKREQHGLSQDLDLEKPSKKLAAFSRQYGFEFLDLYPFFKAANKTLYFRDSHWNEAGHRLAAEILAQHLVGGKNRE